LEQEELDKELLGVSGPAPEELPNVPVAEPSAAPKAKPSNVYYLNLDEHFFI
jgi:hypothetical protein